MRLWTVEWEQGAMLSVCSRPLGDGLLLSEMEDLAGQGVQILVSLLDHDELPILGLVDEGLAAAVAGLRFFHEPTPDGDPPESTDRMLGLLLDLAAEVRGGAHLAVHCRAGHGRSPALAAGVLVAAGMTAAEAVERLSSARGREVPHRSGQQDWVRWVAGQLLFEPPAGTDPD